MRAPLAALAATAALTIATADDVRLRRVADGLVRVTLSCAGAARGGCDLPAWACDGDRPATDARVVSAVTHGRWDFEAWGDGGLPAGGFDAVRRGGGAPAWRVDVSERLRGSTWDGFRARCAPNATARSPAAAALLAEATYASVGAAYAAGGARATADLVVAEAAAVRVFGGAVDGARPRRAVVLVAQHVAARDRSRGAIVYRVAARDAGDVVLSAVIPRALAPRLAASTLAVGGAARPLLGAPGVVLVLADGAEGLVAGAHALEVALYLEAGGEATVSVAYEASLPAFDEWPPDQYRGLDVGPAAAFYGDGAASYGDAVLVALPETDLSMPFNFATLQSTLVAFFVGSVAAGLARRSSTPRR